MNKIAKAIHIRIRNKVCMLSFFVLNKLSALHSFSFIDLKMEKNEYQENKNCGSLSCSIESSNSNVRFVLWIYYWCLDRTNEWIVIFLSFWLYQFLRINVAGRLKKTNTRNGNERNDSKIVFFLYISKLCTSLRV